MSFSKRHGYSTEKILQSVAIDTDLRNGLWNTYYNTVKDQFEEGFYGNIYIDENLEDHINAVWGDFFKKQVDTVPQVTRTYLSSLKGFFSEDAWFKVYDFIEFVASSFSNISTQIGDYYAKDTNKILTREKSAYRLIDTIVVPISNEIEIETINQALDHNLRNVHIHLNTALKFLSDRSNPDYRNSIKESISAVETLCREITTENTLGKAINKFEKSGIVFNQQFKDALVKLYAYTNNETGIRHALLENGQMPDFDEAKFMLVACSAFVNYLISKQSLLNKNSNHE